MTEQTYVFDNAWQQGRARLDAVEQLLDGGSTRYLAETGIQSGWTCLEVGAGGGSIARWMRDTAGPTSHVVATDIETRFLDPLAAEGIEVRRHNVVTDPLEEGYFHLIHARLVLEHLPEREHVTAKLVRALRPGGWLVVESVDYVSGVAVSELGAADHVHTQNVRLEAFRANGLDDTLGRRLPLMLRNAGLVDVENEGRVWVMEGGSPAARWFQLSMEQVRNRLEATGKVTSEQIDRMLIHFADPGWSALSPIIMTAWGRRPTFG